MSFLTMGRSLSEARERPHRYKLKNGMLPTFGNLTVSAKRELETAVVARPWGGVEQKRADSEPMKAGIVAGRLMPVVPVNLFPKVRWGWKLNLFRSARPVERPVVQGELSLDKVKPVRNDLSDSDLELVAPTQPTESAQEAVCMGSEEIPVVRTRPILSRMRALFQRRN